MPSIGDIANGFAAALYEARVPIAILSIVAVVVVVEIARRRGWIAAARRHPARTTVAVAIALAVALPVGWYLASPIFIRTSLVEELPTGAPVTVTADAPSPSPGATPSLGATPSPVTTPSAAPTPSPDTTPSAAPSAVTTPAPTTFTPTIITSGLFHGTDDFHFGSGTASIVETAPGRFHLRLEEFSVRNGPDLFVYLSPDLEGYADDALELGNLKATDGSFGYDLPAGTDPSRFRSALIWCKQFSHLFAVAPFQAG